MRNNRLPRTIPALLVVLMFCGLARAEVKVNGCPSVYPVAFDLSVDYMRRNPGADIRVQPMVTNLAVKALMEGNLDIAMVSRPLTEAERAAGLRDVLLTSEGLTLFVREDNPVEGVTRNEVRQMLRGEIRNWSDLSSPGGSSGPIIVAHHRPECGVHTVAKVRLLGDMNATMVEGEVYTGCPKVVGGVMSNPGRLGYGPYALIKAIPKVRALAVEGVKPDPETIISGKYPYSFGLRLLYRQDASQAASLFLDFAASEEGKRAIAKAGYLPPGP